MKKQFYTINIMKKFNKFEVSQIKKIAQCVDRDVTKKTKLENKIAEMQAEINALQASIDKWQEPIKALTGGYSTEDLVEKEIVVIGNDKEGKPIKAAKYNLKYPETIIPVPEEAAEVVEALTDNNIPFMGEE